MQRYGSNGGDSEKINWAPIRVDLLSRYESHLEMHGKREERRCASSD